jgi:hypothetical protein
MAYNGQSLVDRKLANRASHLDIAQESCYLLCNGQRSDREDR